MKKLFLLITILISIPVIVWAVAGGQGKAQGNNCMSQCMGTNAEFYDAANELTQACQAECNVGTGEGACLTTEDECCVPYTDDPDCVSAGACPCFDESDINGWESSYGQLGTIEYNTNSNGVRVSCGSEPGTNPVSGLYVYARWSETQSWYKGCQASFHNPDGSTVWYEDQPLASIEQYEACENVLINVCG